MGVYSDAEKICILEGYFKTGSCNEVRNILRLRFPNATPPVNSTIHRLVYKFRKTGSIVNISKPHKPSILTEELITVIQNEVMENPRISIRRLAQQVGVSYNIAYRTVRQHLQLVPYKISLVHQLLPADHAARLHFSNWLVNVMDNDETFLNKTFFSDEAWFHLSGYINSQNARYWSSQNPHLIHERPLQPQKIGVWVVMSSERIFVNFFHSTVTSEVYCRMIDAFIETLTEEEVFGAWFQQDNAPAHTSKKALKHLEMYFGYRVISQGLWPARSPDLTPPDFFLWGYLKDRVFENKPLTLMHLRENIVHELSKISPQVLKHVFSSVLDRANLCISANGMHFQHL